MNSTEEFRSFEYPQIYDSILPIKSHLGEIFVIVAHSILSYFLREVLLGAVNTQVKQKAEGKSEISECLMHLEVVGSRASPERGVFPLTIIVSVESK